MGDADRDPLAGWPVSFDSCGRSDGSHYAKNRTAQTPGSRPEPGVR